jgi:iron complex outermembrane receptor protein
MTNTPRTRAVAAHGLVPVVSALLLLNSADGRAADDLAPVQAGLEEVIVTAQKRSENLQETPIAITALTAQALESRGMTEISELARVAPSVKFATTAAVSGSSTAAAVFIRGVGQTDYSLTTEPGVGIYVDGVYVARSIGGVLDVLDLERVEVLRGPQGTLFGRNTIGGAISLVSRRPGAEFGGAAELTVGNRNRLDLRGSFDLPFSETVRSRWTFSSMRRDGYVRGLLDDRLYGDKDRQSARALFDIQLHPDVQLSVAADVTRIREQNAPSTLVGVTITPPGPSGEAPSLSFLYNAFDAPNIAVPGFGNVPYDDRWVPGDIDTTYATGPDSGTKLDIAGGSVTAAWNVDASLTLKFITAFRHTEGSFTNDADGSPLQIAQPTTRPFRHQQLTQELQATGTAAADRLKWAGGLYFLTERGLDILDVPLVPAFGAVVNHQGVRAKSTAAYAQGTYAVTERLGVTAGARYTRDRKYFDPIDSSLTLGPVGFAVFGSTPFYVADGSPFGKAVLVPQGEVGATFSNTAPKAGLEYRFTPDLFGYASYSKGFKSGGFNVRYLIPRPSVLAFAPEKLATSEVGLKYVGFERRLRLNAAAFHSRYEDIQVVVFEQFGAPVTQNAGRARFRGIELEGNARIGAVEVDFGFGWLDSKYTAINQPTTVIGQDSGVSLSDRLPNAPRTTWNLGARYAHALPTGARLEGRVDASYSSSFANDAQNSPFLFQDAYYRVNASLTYGAADDRWDVGVFVDNLTDSRAIMAGNSNFSIGFHEANFDEPRRWGARLRYRF